MNDVPESAKTQCERLLEHLKLGLPLTHRKAEIGYGVQRLAARMYDLKQLGHQIEKRMVEVPTRDGRRARVAEYFLQA
jgi:sigma54-dependent transcription regulator